MINVSAAIGCLQMFCFELYKYEKKKCVIWDTGWWNRFLKQDSYLGNVEVTGETLSKFQ
jgi:hypothetical protein